MQKRSPAKVLVYSLLTLGVYDLIWFTKTRKELMAATGIRIPHVAWLFALCAFRLVALVLLVSSFFVLATPSKAHVGQACRSQYVLSTVPETSATHILSTKCRNQIKDSQAAQARASNATKVLWMVVLLTVLSWVVYPRWLKSYIRAVERVTNGKLTQTSAMILLFTVPTYGIPIVQAAFNNPATIPAQLGTLRVQRVTLPQAIEGNRTLKRTLTIIAITMGTLFVVLVAAMVALFYYGNH